MPHYVFVLSSILLLVACHRDKPARPEIIAPTVTVVSTDSLPKKKAIANTYANYRQLFTKIDIPYTVDLDTIGQGYYFYDSVKGLTDSLGNPYSARFIPKEMAKAWIADSSNLETKGELVDWGPGFDEFFAPDNFGWFTLQPSVRIESADFDFLFILKYAQVSATNGGFSTVYLLTYTKDGRLKKVKSIGRFGNYSTKEVKDMDNYFYFKQTTDIYAMKLIYKTAGKVELIEQKNEEIDLSISGKRELKSNTHKLIYRKHKVIRLL